MYWNGHAEGRAEKQQHHSQPSDPSSAASHSHYDHYSSGTEWSENEQKRKLAAALQATSPRRTSQNHTHESRAESISKSSLSGNNNNTREPVPAGYTRNMVSSTPRGAAGMHGNFTTATPRSQVLDLTRNDNSYHVIAKLIIDRFEDQFNLHSETITVTAGDRYHLDRVVPTKTGFVEAVQYRLRDCPADSSKPIHLITRQCRALGLHLEGDKNLLYAPVGSVIKIDWTDGSLNAGADAVSHARPAGPDDLARQQVLAELREASNLMAESVTPEASKFWRKHVLDLQAKLRALHEKDTENNSQLLRDTKTEDIIKNNERLMASLWENTSYVSPNQEDMFSNVSMNNSIVESKGPSIQQQDATSPVARELEMPEIGLPMVDVVAPADLPGGYQFEAQIDNKHFLATVPVGGIRKGQTFSCLMREMRDSDIPVGRWKDGLFDCFHYGIAHPMLLNSILCPLIALSQVQGREELDVLGRKVAPGTPQTGIYSARGTMITALVLWVFVNTVIISGLELKLQNFVSPSPADIISLVLVNGLMIGFTIYSTVSTRSAIRERYHIEEEKKQSTFRDAMTALFCLPLSISQMGRHTASYEENSGACCNDTGVGLPRNTDGAIV